MKWKRNTCEFPITSKSGQWLCLSPFTRTKLCLIHHSAWSKPSLFHEAAMPTRQHHDFCVKPTEDGVLPTVSQHLILNCTALQWTATKKYLGMPTVATKFSKITDLTAVILNILNILDKYTLFLLLQNGSVKLEAKTYKH